MNESGIIEAIKKSQNKKVLKELYKVALPSITAFVKSNGGSKDDAEDCFQEGVIALIVAVKSDKFKPDYSVRNYLFGVVRNKWFDEVKRRGLHVEQDAVKEPSDQEYPIILDKERTGILNDLVRSVGEKCAELLKLIIFENKRQKEVKDLLGFNNEDVVKATYYRCKQKLRENAKQVPGLRTILHRD